MEDLKMETDGVVTPDGIEARAQAALRSMETLRDVLDRKAEMLREMPVEGVKPEDLTKLQRDLAKAVTLAVEMEGKVADARRIERGGDGLDLEDARAEIWSRLDSLAAAG
ncbi:hypothetical protein [Jannaschia sp. M317]|uniref:hypothetical protein n=1 Tax=Jannaschia sp. M317 TaxID=2867011 RepID=UPI0021A7B78F|nr:hypothetical protein [Jannaschia sp. M317]UWQ16996.1 hypothetical protein K3551_14000 [Jannaschia sp. M317]